MAKGFVYRLEKFPGLHTASDSQGELIPGESPDLVNFKITQGYDLKKREGYTALFAAPETIRGIWAGAFGKEERYLLVAGNTLYHSREGFDSLAAASGTVPGDGKVSIMEFHDGIYFLTGVKICRYDGEKIEPLVPHIPTVMISTPPDGAGVLFEEKNILSDRVIQKFSPDGDSVKFYAAVSKIRYIVRVSLEGEDLTSEQFRWDDIGHYVELAIVPDAGIDTLEVEFLLPGNDVAERIHGCRYAIGFGGANDTRVFLYGNDQSPSMRYHSGVIDGKPAFSYFPETGYTMVGTGEPITAILRHYDRQLIFTPEAAYYSFLEYITGEEGLLIASFPVLPLSDDKGNVPVGQALLMENTPCTLTETGLYLWISTNVRDERNAKCISDSIAQALRGEKSENAILFNRKGTSELYLAFGQRIYVYNYRLKVFYRYEIPLPPQGFCERGGELYFVSENTVYRVGGDTDNGEEICARWESGPLDFSDATRQKNLFQVALYGRAKMETRVILTVEAENEEGKWIKTVLFPTEKEFSLTQVRTMLRGAHLVRLRLETQGDGEFLLRSIRFKGRITDKTSE